MLHYSDHPLCTVVTTLSAHALKWGNRKHSAGEGALSCYVCVLTVLALVSLPPWSALLGTLTDRYLSVSLYPQARASAAERAAEAAASERELAERKVARLERSRDAEVKGACNDARPVCSMCVPQLPWPLPNICSALIDCTCNLNVCGKSSFSKAHYHHPPSLS